MNTIKYGDNNLIVNIYTDKFGRQSYLHTLSRTSKSKNKAGLFQPLFILEIEAWQKSGRNLQRIKEARNVYPYKSIPFQVIKTTQAIFIAEFMGSILREEGSDQPLFHFVENALIAFDEMCEGAACFHIWLLAHLTDFLGVMPDIENAGGEWLDMQKGIFVASEPAHSRFMNPEMAGMFRKMLLTNICEIHTFKYPGEKRNQLLGNILTFYHQHFNNISGLKSSEIFKDIFS
ncbi:MAG: recombination protein O N-terminal domain-containing protein [Prolixibacteraceae bacterium]|nr:recombination protein O N-terminal domain-containing protein [Prolixibacteraceae bacterium]